MLRRGVDWGLRGHCLWHSGGVWDDTNVYSSILLRAYSEEQSSFDLCAMIGRPFPLTNLCVVLCVVLGF